MSIRFDSDQSEYRGALDQITTQTATSVSLDLLLESLNKAVTSPLRMRASSTPNLVVNIDSITVTNPQTGRKNTITPINGLLPTFTSGTITLGATGAGSATPSVGSALGLGMIASQFMKIGVHLTSAGAISLTKGSAAASLSGATHPALVTGAFPIGWFYVETNGSNAVQSVGEVNINSYSGSITTFDAGALIGTTLASNVVTSSLTTVGALNSGSITSGFGAIDIGSDALTAGAGNFSGSVAITVNDSTLRVANGANTAGAFFGHRQSDGVALWGALGSSAVVTRVNSADVGGISTAGAWTLGASSGTDAIAHTLNGSLSIDNANPIPSFSSSTLRYVGNKYSNILFRINNAANSGPSLRAGSYFNGSSELRSVLNQSAARFSVRTQTSASSEAFGFDVDVSTGAADSAITHVSIASATGAGAWTFPVNTQHNIGSGTAGADAQTVLAVKAGGSTRKAIFYMESNAKFLQTDLASDGSWSIYDGVTAGKYASVTYAGAWTLGPSVVSSTATHQVRGRQGVLSSYQGTFSIITNDSATGEPVLAFGLDKVGGNAWISPASQGVGTGPGLRFGSFVTDVGGYTSAGAWTLGASGAGSTTHQANGNLKVLSANSNSNFYLRNSTTGDALGLQLQQDGVNTYLINGSNGIMGFYTNNTSQGSVSAAGAWTLGASGDTTSTHSFNGFQLTLFRSGSGKLGLIPSGSENYFDSYGANASTNGGFQFRSFRSDATNNTSLGSISSAGAWTLGSVSGMTSAALVVQGWSTAANASSASNGEIKLGVTASSGARLQHNDGGNTHTYLDNRYDSASSQISFRLRTDATPVTAINMTGAGVVTLGDTANTAFTGNKIVGRKDGSAVPAGFIGEVRTFTQRTVATTAGGDFEANATALDTLTAGRWQVFTYAQANITLVTALTAAIASNGTSDGTGLLGRATIIGQRTLDQAADSPIMPFIIDVATTQQLFAKANTVGASGNVNIGGYAVRIA